MRTKTFFATLIALMVSFTLAGCGTPPDPTKETPPPDRRQVEPPKPTTGEVKLVSSLPDLTTRLVRVDSKDEVLLKTNQTVQAKPGKFQEMSTAPTGRVTVLDVKPSYYTVNAGKVTTIERDSDPNAHSAAAEFQGKECRLIYNNRPSGEASTVSYKERNGKLNISAGCGSFSGGDAYGHQNEIRQKDEFYKYKVIYTKDKKDPNIWILSITKTDLSDNQTYTDICHCR